MMKIRTTLCWRPDRQALWILNSIFDRWRYSSRNARHEEKKQTHKSGSGGRIDYEWAGTGISQVYFRVLSRRAGKGILSGRKPPEWRCIMSAGATCSPRTGSSGEWVWRDWGRWWIRCWTELVKPPQQQQRRLVPCDVFAVHGCMSSTHTVRKCPFTALTGRGVLLLCVMPFKQLHSVFCS